MASIGHLAAQMSVGHSNWTKGLNAAEESLRRFAKAARAAGNLATGADMARARTPMDHFMEEMEKAKPRLRALYKAGFAHTNVFADEVDRLAKLHKDATAAMQAQAKAAGWYERTLSPLEKMRREMQEINRLYDKGKGPMDRLTYTRARSQIKEDYFKTTPDYQRQKAGEAMLARHATPLTELRQGMKEANELFSRGVIGPKLYHAEVKSLNETYQKTTPRYAMMEKAKDLFEQTRTPLETMRTKMAEVNRMHQLGVINGDLHARSVAAIQKEYWQATSVMAQFTQHMKSIAFYGAMATAAMGVRTGFQTAAYLESQEVSMEVFMGSAEKAQSTIKDLRKFAVETPFRITEVMGAATMLHAYGAAGDSVTDTLRMLGDVAAGVNKPLEDITWLFGTTKAEGKVLAKDLRQFGTRGIPMIAELTKMFGLKNESEVFGLTEAGVLRFEHIKEALTNMTSEGGRFYGLTEKQSKTTGGLWAKLADNTVLTLGAVAQAFIDAFDLKSVMQGTYELTEGLEGGLRSLLSPLGEVAGQVRDLVGFLAKIPQSIGFTDYWSKTLEGISIGGGYTLAPDFAAWGKFALAVGAGAIAFKGFLLLVRLAPALLYDVTHAAGSIKSGLLSMSWNPVALTVAAAAFYFSILSQRAAEARDNISQAVAEAGKLGEMSDEEFLGKRVQFLSLDSTNLIDTTAGDLIKAAKENYQTTEAQILSALRFAENLEKLHKEAAQKFAEKSASEPFFANMYGWWGDDKEADAKKSQVEKSRAMELAQRVAILKQTLSKVQADKPAAADPAAKAALIADGVKKLEESLRKSINTFGLSEHALKVWEMANDGATASQTRYDQAMVNARNSLGQLNSVIATGNIGNYGAAVQHAFGLISYATQAAAANQLKFAGSLVKVREELDKLTKLSTGRGFGATMNSYFANVMKLAQMRGAGAFGPPDDPKTWDVYRNAVGKLNAELTEFLGKEADAVFMNTRTPMEKFEDELHKLDFLLQKDLITWDTYQRAVMMAGEQLDKTGEAHENLYKAPGAMEFGSSEALSAIARFERESVAKARKNGEKEAQKKLQEEANKKLQKLIDLFGNLNPIKIGKIG